MRLVLCDVVFLAFLGMVTYGLWLIYPPVAFIILGMLGMGGVLAARRGRRLGDGTG